MSLLDVPEIKALICPDAGSGHSLIRIPHQIDVPVTDRVLRLVDTEFFQGLRHISQLGVVRMVYPAAHHTRFEHSLGVYRNALLFLQHFAGDSRFDQLVQPKDACRLLLAALLHDVGHWPFCHPIEDLSLDGIPDHESFAFRYLKDPQIESLLAKDWGTTPEEVFAIIDRKPSSAADRLLCSILSGPIDIDKMDYLYRDSLHAGVPYGQNFDAPRLIRSLCLNLNGDRLAITRKGKTAAELMVFARYVMFSEVYWHPAVRSATAMFQRAFYDWYQRHQARDDLQACCQKLFESSETEMIHQLSEESKNSHAPSQQLLEGLFGKRRQLFKLVASYAMDQNEKLYSLIAQRPYDWIVECGARLARQLKERLRIDISAHDVLIDAPPVGLEVQFEVDVFYGPEDGYRRLGDVSPVVKTLATRQFDDFVKQVRVFVAPHLRDPIQHSIGPGQMDQLLAEVTQKSSKERRR